MKLYALKKETLKIAYDEVTQHNNKANFVKSHGAFCFSFQ